MLNSWILTEMMMAMVLRKGNILTQTPDSTEWIQTKRQICASSEMCARKFCAAVQCYWIVRCCSLMGGQVCAQRCWRMCSNAKAICPISVNMPCPSHSCHSEGERSGNGCNLLTMCLCCKHFQCDILSYVVRSCCHILRLCWLLSKKMDTFVIFLPDVILPLWRRLPALEV